jgi:D-xylose transport system ATP-binding protein
MTATNGAPILEVRDATKYFGAVQALGGVSLTLHRNEVLALLGDNGAGKSTLIKAISGIHQLDGGEILVDGEERRLKSAQDARAAGIETVYQDLALFDNLSAADNFYAGRELTTPSRVGSLGFVRARRMERETQQLLDELQVVIPGDSRTQVGLMSGGQRQAIAVARAVAFASEIVILDEPTAALGVRESRNVLRLIARLAERGIAVIVISHNLEQVIEMADRAVVMRRGRIVGEAVPTHENHERLVSMIVGGGTTDGQGPIPTGGGDR